MKYLLAFVLIVLLNAVQVGIRHAIDFYPDNIGLSIFIGVIIGAFVGLGLTLYSKY